MEGCNAALTIAAAQYCDIGKRGATGAVGGAEAPGTLAINGCSPAGSQWLAPGPAVRLGLVRRDEPAVVAGAVQGVVSGEPAVALQHPEHLQARLLKHIIAWREKKGGGCKWLLVAAAAAMHAATQLQAAWPAPVLASGSLPLPPAPGRASCALASAGLMGSGISSISRLGGGAGLKCGRGEGIFKTKW